MGLVRELQNDAGRAVVLAEGSRVDIDDLPDEVRTATFAMGGPGHGATPADVEREQILAALKTAGSNKAQAAIQLGNAPATLFRKLKPYGASSV